MLAKKRPKAEDVGKTPTSDQQESLHVFALQHTYLYIQCLAASSETRPWRILAVETQTATMMFSRDVDTCSKDWPVSKTHRVKIEYRRWRTNLNIASRYQITSTAFITAGWTITCGSPCSARNSIFSLKLPELSWIKFLM